MTTKENKNKGHSRLTLYIVLAIVAAVVLAMVFPHFAEKFEIGGLVFLRLLQMIVVPLVMASVMSGILGLGDVRKLGKPGSCALAFYLSTTILAVVTGLIVVNTVNPGVGIDPQLVEDAREEGAREVKKAADAMDDEVIDMTFQDGDHLRTSTDATSDVVAVPVGGQRALVITVVQKGVPNTPAKVAAMWSDDGEKYQLLKSEDSQEGQTIIADTKPGTYKEVVKLPKKAKFVRLDVVAQVGGDSSVVTASLTPAPPTIGDIFKGLVLMLFTDNLLKAMVNMDLLPLIVFSIVFAGMLTTMGRRSESIANLVISINDALMSFIMLLMKVAPLGIFCLVTARFGKAQADGKFIELLQVQAYYIVTVLVGLAIHALITLPVIFYVFTRRNPYRYLGQMSQAVLTAFSTASSTATLPVTMECAEVEAGVSRRSAEFVLPLGATINMDGTALYEAAAAIFIAQALPGFDLTLTAQLTIAVTATLAAIGAAGIPEAGLVTMLIVLNAVGLPLELIGLIIPVDWLLDRFRTAVNVFGDSIGAAVVDQTFESS